MRTLLLIATLTFTMSSVFAGATSSECGDISSDIFSSGGVVTEEIKSDATTV